MHHFLVLNTCTFLCIESSLAVVHEYSVERRKRMSPPPPVHAPKCQPLSHRYATALPYSRLGHSTFYPSFVPHTDYHQRPGKTNQTPGLTHQCLNTQHSRTSYHI